jgi:antibiotic biosynthesis monooxygenase (ABM) superfamily enzyme
MKKLLLPLFVLLFAATSLPTFAASATAPTTIVHVITVSWKKDATPDQIKAALDGAQKLPAAYPGITHVWTKTLKAQGERSNAIVMEFAGADVFKAYTNSAAQKEWYKVYLPVRERSTTFDVTNE